MGRAKSLVVNVIFCFGNAERHLNYVGHLPCMQSNERPAVKSVRTNFEIVHALVEMEGARISNLADRLEMPISTLHDHLDTLKQLDYVVQRDQHYFPGIRFLEIGGRARKSYKVYRIGKPVVDQLATKSGDHANLMIEENGIGSLVYKSRGDNAIQLDTYTGMRMRLHTTAMGKAILAHTPDDRLNSLMEESPLEAVTDNTITDPESLKAELEDVREKGYATDVEERIEGVSCVAAPIIDEDGNSIAAISISGPSKKIRGNTERQTMIDDVQKGANIIEVNLTFS